MNNKMGDELEELGKVSSPSWVIYYLHQLGVLQLLTSYLVSLSRS